jgi:peptide/nickel transport system ATP-binding protein
VVHDLSVVRHISDRVAVMYVGRMVELAETEEIFAAPKHPYTAALLSAVSEPDPRIGTRRIILEGEMANPAPPEGSYFHPPARKRSCHGAPRQSTSRLDRPAAPIHPCAAISS